MTSTRQIQRVLPQRWITGGIGFTPDGRMTARVRPGLGDAAAARLRHAGLLDVEVIEMAMPRARNGFPELPNPIPFDQMFAELGWVCDRGRIDDFDLELHDGVTAEHERNPRRYAQVTAHDRPPLFEFAEQTMVLTWPHRLGLYAHEVGHVLDPDPNKTEPGADQTALRELGIRIGYDRRWPGKGLQVALSGPGIDV